MLAWGDSLYLDETGSGVTCHGDSTFGSAELGTDQTAWFDPSVDTQADFQGQPQAALGYGQALQAGNMVCQSQTTGVTCLNLATHKGFFISRESYQLF